MISGALRATANSSGVLLLPSDVHPAAESAATSRRAEEALSMFNRLRGVFALWAFLTSEERSQQQDHDADANRCVADIEYQKRPDVAEVQVGEVHDIAETGAIEDVAERSPEHEPERSLVEAVLLASDPNRDGNRNCRCQGDQHPAPDGVRRIEKPKRNPVVLGVGQVEDGKQHDLLADAIEVQRAGHDPFRQLVEYEDRKRDHEAEAA